DAGDTALRRLRVRGRGGDQRDESDRRHKRPPVETHENLPNLTMFHAEVFRKTCAAPVRARAYTDFTRRSETRGKTKPRTAASAIDPVNLTAPASPHPTACRPSAGSRGAASASRAA